MNSLTHIFPRNLLMLMSLVVLSLCSYQQAQAAPVACTYTIEGGTSKFIADGKPLQFAITVRASAPNCTWTAKSNHSWIHISNGGSYTGSAQVIVDVDHNDTQKTREGSINMAGDIYTITQEDDCFYILTDLIQTVSKAGGEVKIKAASNCPAMVVPEVSWIKFNGPTNHPPFGSTITFTVAPNNGLARTGRVKIAKYYLTVYQEGTCQYLLSTTSQNVKGSGGNHYFDVAVHRTCPFNPTSDSVWVKITSTTRGTENGRYVDYSVAPNSGAARTAKITIAGQQFTVSQAAGQPEPKLLYVNPGFVAAGSSDLTLTLTGNNFTSSTRVKVNGLNYGGTFVSNTQIKFTLPATSLKNPATHQITVEDPLSGHPPSNEQPFLVLSPQASVSAASYKGEEIAPDSIVAAFGVKLADSTAVSKTVPLPTSLAGTMVRVRDSKGIERLAPLFFVSPGQVNYLMPADTALGEAMVIIISGSVNISLGYVTVVKVAPGVFTATANGTGHPSALALRVKANGAQVYESVVRFDQATQKFVAVPIDLSVAGEQVFLVLYGTGMRQRTSLDNVNLTIGGTPASTAFAGPSGLTGLDQLNAPLPATLAGRGEVNMVLNVDGKAANTVKLTFK